MRRGITASVAVLGAALAVAGCETNKDYMEAKENHRLWAAHNDPLYIAGRPSKDATTGVTWTQMSYIAQFRPRSSRLTARTRQEIKRLGARHRGRGTRVTVLMDVAEGRAGQRLLERRRKALLRCLNLNGLTDAKVSVVPGSRHRNSAVVMVATQTAATSTCREWMTVVGTADMRAERWRYGCVTRSSLRAHIDNPAHLKGGGPLGDYDGVSAAKSIEDYQKGKLDKLPESSGTSGN